jgi:GNAT superfamily N-acetyltransferase
VGIEIHTYAERPELWEGSDERGAQVWPEYNLHGDVLNRHWDRLFALFPDCQFVLADGDEVLAEGHTAPCPWDGTAPGLGPGIDAALAAACEAREAGTPPGALCALAAEIPPCHQGRGLASRILDAMASIARAHGLQHLIAPVRPSLKERYPLTSIERYITWVRDDGQPLDPWIRTHTRRGGVIAAPAPQSMRITGTVSDWERWTDMVFPDDGDYVFARGLAPLHIEHGQDLGSYWEPNVWIIHTI